MTPAGTSNELDVQNEWEENTHTLSSVHNNFSKCTTDSDITTAVLTVILNTVLSKTALLYLTSDDAVPLFHTPPS